MSIFDSVREQNDASNETPKPKVRFEWKRDNDGNIVLPSLPDVPVEITEQADELSVSYVQSDTSINDDGSAHTESVEVKATRHRRTAAEMAGVPQAPKAKWEETVRDNLKKNLKFMEQPLRELLDRDANEGDTRMIVNEILVKGLGYDRFTEITTEYMIRGEFSDYGLKIENKVKVIVEVKRVGKRLADKDVRQAEVYALREGVEWAILTNGISWRLYHVTASVPTKLDLLFDVSVLDDIDSAIDSLYYMTRVSLGRNQVATLWERSEATNEDAMRSIILSNAVVQEVRRELNRVSGVRLDGGAVEKLISAALH